MFLEDAPAVFRPLLREPLSCERQGEALETGQMDNGLNKQFLYFIVGKDQLYNIILHSTLQHTRKMCRQEDKMKTRKTFPTQLGSQIIFPTFTSSGIGAAVQEGSLQKDEVPGMAARQTVLSPRPRRDDRVLVGHHQMRALGARQVHVLDFVGSC